VLLAELGEKRIFGKQLSLFHFPISLGGSEIISQGVKVGQ